MARVFISHSSRDKEPAERIKAWLNEQGFEAPFIDSDKHTGIPPGADWERTLYREIERSEAVIIIQSPNWLESKWCFAEFTQARALGKPIFPISEAPTDGALISADIQTLDLRSDRVGGLERLSRELTQIALDAQGGFNWDVQRPPYPGLLAFQEEDAAIYFGRDDDIRHLIERLNARRAQGGAKFIALLGASGSGKSSLLRAGIIPRLRRARRNWIVLPPMRPQARPVDELAQCLAIACGANADWRELRRDLNGQDVGQMLNNIARDLRVKAAANEAQILLPIDQVEELFGVADPDEAQRFFEILNATMSDDRPFLAIMALRSDYLGELQSVELLKAKFEEFSFGPMPLERIAQIIEGPARVAGLNVDDAFVQQAVRDAKTSDALPLLAFALRELYDRGSEGRYLSLPAYNALGDAEAKLTPLENSVRKAADDVLTETKPSDEELTALRDAFLPAMVRVNDQGEYVRRPARWHDLPSKSHPLLERLTKARLLIVSQQGDDRIVEVAHEALLRKWPRLRNWLDEAREFLTGKQQLEVDLRDWERATKPDKPEALLAGLKLHRAQGWLLARPQQLSEKERAYIRASIDQNERRRRIVTWGSIGAAAVLAFVAVFAGLQWRSAVDQRDHAVQAESATEKAKVEAQISADRANLAQQEAQRQRDLALKQQSLLLAKFAKDAYGNNDMSLAALLAIQGLPNASSSIPVQRDRPFVNEASDVLAATITRLRKQSRFSLDGDLHLGTSGASVGPKSRKLVTKFPARLWDVATMKWVPIGQRPLDCFNWSSDGGYFADRASGGTPQGSVVEIRSSSDGNVVRSFDGAQFGKLDTSGSNVVLGYKDGKGKIIHLKDGQSFDVPLDAASFSADGRYLLIKSANKGTIYSATNPAEKALLKGGLDSGNNVDSCRELGAQWSVDGKRLLATSRAGSLGLWEVPTGRFIGNLGQGSPYEGRFEGDGARFAIASGSGLVIWNASNGKLIGRWSGDDHGETRGLNWSPDGRRIVVAFAKSIMIFSTEQNDPQPTWQLNAEGDSEFAFAVWTPDANRIVVAPWGGELRLFDVHDEPKLERGAPLPCNFVDYWTAFEF